MTHPIVLRRGSLLDRLARCMSVSVLTTVLSMTILVTLTAGFGVSAWLANVVAVAVGTFPSYALNRRWVWRREGQSDPWREVLPFWVLSFSGLVLSTVTVALADRWARHTALGGFGRSVTLVVADVGAYGVLWVAQFVILDRVLFGRDRTVSA